MKKRDCKTKQNETWKKTCLRLPWNLQKWFRCERLLFKPAIQLKTLRPLEASDLCKASVFVKQRIWREKSKNIFNVTIITSLRKGFLWRFVVAFLSQQIYPLHSISVLPHFSRGTSLCPVCTTRCVKHLGDSGSTQQTNTCLDALSLRMDCNIL